MKSVLDNLQREPRPRMWQKFENKGIVHKEIVPLGKTVYGKFYRDNLRRMRENIQRKCLDMMQQLLGSPSWQRSGSCVAQGAAVFRFYKDDSHPPPSLLIGPRHLWIFPIPEDEIEAQGMR